MGIGYLKSIGYRDTVNLIVVAFCRDFFARKAAIDGKQLSRRTLMEYEYINTRLTDAVREIVGDDYETYIREIGEGIGYAGSNVLDICESEYKKIKKEAKVNIAKKLHLID